MSSALTNDFPVEIVPPDISDWKAGNTSIPYCWSFTADNPGPHAMICAVVHGNELCGAIAVDWLLRRGVRPVRGTLSLAFMNVDALLSFDPEDPNASRYLDEDFNRVWDRAVLDGPRNSRELTRARAVRPLIDSVDHLLDLHSMLLPAPPVSLAGTQAKGIELARGIGLPDMIVADAGHAEGRRLRDYGAFAEAGSPKSAVLLECGQHWRTASADLAKRCAIGFLTHLGMAPPELTMPEAGQSPDRQTLYEVTHPITVETDSFVFVDSYIGGEIIEKAGTVIARDGLRDIRTPYDNCLLLMPNRRLWPGQTAVRLARLVA